MFLHNSTLLYIVSLFNGRVRRCALFSLELTNTLVIVVVSIALFDHLLNDETDTFINPQNGLDGDNFTDLAAYLMAPRSNGSDLDRAVFETVIIRTIFNESDNPTLAEVLALDLTDDATSFQRYQMTVRKQELYREGDPLIDELLHDLATWPIESVEHYKGGTQAKMYVNFTNNAGRAMMKPMKCPREQETLPDHYMFRDLERHNAEIAAFHLDRALGFRRAGPVVGRILNMTTEIEEICDENLKETFFMSPDAANRKCFHGFNCSQYCNVLHPLCGNPDTIEVAMAAFYPFFKKGDEKHQINPWRRAYSERRKAEWTKDDEWCSSVMLEDKYSPDRRRILDMMDMHIMDFLMGNQDRHHYEIFSAFEEEDNTTASLIHLDHGRSFGRAFWDDHVILTPIRQCCLIRESTLATLLRYHSGPVKLSEHMRRSMATDPVAPILWEPHFKALDRRVGLILQEIRNCINKTIPQRRQAEADIDAQDDSLYETWNKTVPGSNSGEKSDIGSEWTEMGDKSEKRDKHESAEKGSDAKAELNEEKNDDAVDANDNHYGEAKLEVKDGVENVAESEGEKEDLRSYSG